MDLQLIQRQRHLRAVWYLVVSLGLGLFSHLFLGFDATQTFGYAVSSFIMLHVVNFRVMFARLGAPQAKQSTESE